MSESKYEMEQELQDCIDRALDTRKRLIDGAIDVKRANAESTTNHQVISAYAIDLRKRIFLADQEAAMGIGRRTGGRIEDANELLRG